MVFQTLYKTPNPEAGPPEEAEFYTLLLTFKGAQGQRGFFVIEKHGYWDETKKRPVHVVTTLSPEEGFATFNEAEVLYRQQLDYRLKAGFVHSFTPDVDDKGPHLSTPISHVVEIFRRGLCADCR